MPQSEKDPNEILLEVDQFELDTLQRSKAF